MAKKAKKNFKQEQLELEEEKVVEEEVSDEETDEIEEDEIEESEELEENEEESEDSEEDDEDDSDEDDEDDSDEDDEDEEDDDEDDDSEDNEEETRVIVKNPVRKTMSDKARYIIVSVACIALIALIVVMAVFGSKDKDKNSTSNSNTPTTSNAKENIKKEDRNTSTDFLKEFYKEMDSKEKNVIFFASATCGYCTLEKPIIENISKDYDLKYYAIDASTLNQTELNEVVRALGIRGATPTTVIVKEGKVLNYNEGYLDGKPFVEFFKKNELLPKDAKYKQEANIKDVTYSEFKEKAKKDKTNIFIVDQSACQACSKAREVLNKLSEKYKFEVYNLNAANMSKEEVNKLVDEDLKKMEFDNDAYKKDKEVKIPLVLIVKDNKIKSYVIESSNVEDFTKVLKKYDFIK